MEKSPTTTKIMEKSTEIKFDVRIENKYRVNLTSSDYFEVDSILINLHRFVNLRSIHGHISGKDFSIADPTIQPIVMDYLRYQNNIELINILSRELNKFNYFDIYDGLKETDMKLSKHEILNETEHPGIPGCSYNKEILNRKGMILPEKLYGFVNPNIPVFTEINFGSLNFYPIWHINGNKYAKSKYCPLFCHFDILIHVLSKVFVTFKVQILKLAGTDIQIAKERNQTVEDYSEHSRTRLIEMLMEKDNELKKRDEKIDELIRKVDESNRKHDETMKKLEESNKREEEAKKRHEELMRELAESHRKHDETMKRLDESNQKLDESNRKLDELKLESNQKFMDLETSSRNRHEEYMKMIDKIFNRTSSDVVQTFPNEKITTGTAKEVMVFIDSRELNLQFDLLDYKTDEEIVLDTIVCQSEHLQKNKKKHDFDEERDRIIFRFPSSNSLDIFKYIDMNIDRNLARVFSTTGYIRKIIVNRSRMEEFLRIIQTYVNSITVSRETITNAIGSAKDLLTGYIQEKMEESTRDFESKMFREVRELRQEVQQVNEIVTRRVQQVTGQVRTETQERVQEVRETVQQAVTEIQEAVITIREEIPEQVRETIREEIQTQVQEQIQTQVREEVNRTVEEVIENRLLQYINEHRYRKIWYNNYYRDIHLRDGKVYVYPYVSSNQLTEIPDDRDPRNRKFKR